MIAENYVVLELWDYVYGIIVLLMSIIGAILCFKKCKKVIE